MRCGDMDKQACHIIFATQLVHAAEVDVVAEVAAWIIADVHFVILN